MSDQPPAALERRSQGLLPEADNHPPAEGPPVDVIRVALAVIKAPTRAVHTVSVRELLALCQAAIDMRLALIACRANDLTPPYAVPREPDARRPLTPAEIVDLILGESE